MNRNTINTSGNVAGAQSILKERARGKASFRVLAELDISDEAKLRIHKSYKRLRIIQPLAIFGTLLASILIVTLICSALFLPSDNPNMFVMLLLGAIGVLPAVFTGMRVAKGTDWQIYYSWYKEHENKRHIEDYTASLCQELGIEYVQETAEESNVRVAKELRAKGASEEQIANTIKAREDFQIRNGDLEEPEEMTDARIKEQMRKNGYTEEQIRDAFSGRN